MYVHENNLKNKIKNDYKGLKKELDEFYKTIYLPMRENVLALDFSTDDKENFQLATNLFNEYYSQLLSFSKKYSITSQSKFESTFLEEISVYLVKDIESIRTGKLGIFNKKIYAGLKISGDHAIGIITKDVDFCIGKKADITIDNQPKTTLILPIIAVEVKTYLDATMFGEVKSSSKSIRSASPNSKTYVLMGYKNIADEHIIAARQDSVLNEIFVLRKDENSAMDSNVIYDYCKELCHAIEALTMERKIETPGRLLNPDKTSGL